VAVAATAATTDTCEVHHQHRGNADELSSSVFPIRFKYLVSANVPYPQGYAPKM